MSNISPSTDFLTKKKSKASLYDEHVSNESHSKEPPENYMSTTLGQSNFNCDQIALAEKESDAGSLVSSIDDTEKENLKKRVHELEMLYNASIKELQVVENRNNDQKELVIIQDKLIQNMSNQLESSTTETTESEDSVIENIQLDTLDGKQALETAQKELALIKEELIEFKSLKVHYEQIIDDMSTRLSLYDNKLDEMEQIAKRIQRDNLTQVDFIDTKVQTLVQKLLETNGTINKLQVEHFQEKQALLAKQQQELVSNNGSIRSLNDSSSVIWETFEEKEDVSRAGSTRSSFISSDNQQRKSFIARWKGSAMPPASPPPSQPLPPIPTTASRSTGRPKSTLSEIYASNSSSTMAQNYKHVSIDAVGGVGRRTSSVQSELEMEITDAAYYKEFTDQLQERLSVSKEIDDLTVWKPSDYDAIQKKIDSKRWSSNSEDGSQRDQTAFWKGMKKKLRV
jgi:hypothetical protein